MSKFTARHLNEGFVRPRLAAVEWPIPSTEPDTSELDDSWFEVSPRHSFIALKGALEREPNARASGSVSAASNGAPLAYDLWESPHALVVLVDLPGVAAEHVALSLGSKALHLDLGGSDLEHAWPATPHGHHELPLPAELAAGPEAIDALLRNGLLRIRIAKRGDGTRRVAIVTSPELE